LCHVSGAFVLGSGIHEEGTRLSRFQRWSLSWHIPGPNSKISLALRAYGLASEAALHIPGVPSLPDVASRSFRRRGEVPAFPRVPGVDGVLKES
jgi:hypothetical protein